MDDEHQTPPDGIRLPASPESTALANLALALVAIATDVGEAARIFDGLSGAALESFKASVDRQLRETGGLMHDAARAVRGLG